MRTKLYLKSQSCKTKEIWQQKVTCGPGLNSRLKKQPSFVVKGIHKTTGKIWVRTVDKIIVSVLIDLSSWFDNYMVIIQKNVLAFRKYIVYLKARGTVSATDSE